MTRHYDRRCVPGFHMFQSPPVSVPPWCTSLPHLDRAVDVCRAGRRCECRSCAVSVAVVSQFPAYGVWLAVCAGFIMLGSTRRRMIA